MDRQEMIDKIYEVVADKTPSFGCLYKTKAGDTHPLLYREYNLKKNKDESFLFSKMRGKYTVYTNDCIAIGHPVMIGDILDWMGKNGYFYFCNHNKHVQFKGFEPIFSCEGVRSEEEKNSGWHGTNIYCKYNDYQVTLGNMREEKREPIENQSEECIKFIYNLITPHVPKKENSN